MHSITIKFLRRFAILAILGNSALTLAAVPQINSIGGSVSDGQTITVLGANFTAKENAKPLLFWSADTGISPSNLGRKTAWDNSAFGGTIVDKVVSGGIVAEGSNKVLRYDLGLSEAAILSRVSFASDNLYFWRKRYDDFDIEKDFAIRTRYAELQSLSNENKISVGMLMSTEDKKLWGKVISTTLGSSTGSGTAFYSNEIGNLTNYAAASVVRNGSVLYFYDDNDTALSKPLLSAKLNEGSGIYHTFNHKIFRIWGSYDNGGPNSFFVSLDKAGGGVSVSQTESGVFYNRLWDNQINSPKNRWAIEEVQYAASSGENVKDGKLFFWQDRVQAWLNRMFTFRTKTYPLKYSDLYQNQVSNGAQPLSYEYFDALYVDDTWHRVQVCAESTWSKCKQPELIIPSAWSDTKITGKLRLGSLKNKSSFYVYVTNAQGEVNEIGYPSCPMCPLPPAPQ